MNRFRHLWITPLAAAFLLLFTAVDLAYPRMCGEDGGDVVAAAAASSTASLANPDSNGSTPQPHVDDCFCCCGHVVAGAPFVLVTPPSVDAATLPVTASHRSISPNPTYRPPETV